MAKKQAPVLLLTDVESAALRRAKIRIRDLGTLGPELVAQATRGEVTLERAREHCALVALQEVDGIGTSLAYDFHQAGITHPRELVGLSAAELAVRVQGATGRQTISASYMRTLEVAVTGIARMYGSKSGEARPKLQPIVEQKKKPTPLPGKTKRAEILQRPYVATLDQVQIRREGHTAIIEYAEEGIWGTHFKIGPELPALSDANVLERFNAHLEAAEEHRRGLDLPAVEIPIGKPQIEWSERSHQWVPRGHVLRCLIHEEDGDARQPRVIVDDKDLSWEQFGRMLVTFAGWGMRIVFVGNDELDEEPDVVVRDIDEDGG